MFVARIYTAVDDEVGAGFFAIPRVVNTTVIVGVFQLMVAAATRPHPDLGMVIPVTSPCDYRDLVTSRTNPATGIVDTGTATIFD
jgi:hypothetical protein